MIRSIRCWLEVLWWLNELESGRRRRCCCVRNCVLLCEKLKTPLSRPVILQNQIFVPKRCVVTSNDSNRVKRLKSQVKSQDSRVKSQESRLSSSSQQQRCQNFSKTAVKNLKKSVTVTARVCVTFDRRVVTARSDLCHETPRLHHELQQTSGSIYSLPRSQRPPHTLITATILCCWPRNHHFNLQWMVTPRLVAPPSSLV